MTTINPFLDNDAFNMTSLTDAMNLIEPTPTRFSSLGLFREESVSTRTVMVEFDGQNVSIIDPEAVGTRGKQQGNSKRKVVPIAIPHFPREAAILPQEFAGLRAFGSENALVPFQQVMSKKLSQLEQSHAMTHEFMRTGAMKGLVVDSQGGEILDVWKMLGVKKVEAAIDVSKEVLPQCLKIKRLIEAGLLGDTHSSIRVEVSPEFFDKLITAATVKQAYANWSEAAARLGSDMRDGFTFGGLTFVENGEYSRDFNGKLIRHIDANKGIAFPLGTQNTFREYVTCADFLETVNTIGRRYYVKTEPRAFNRGIDIHSQSNVIPVCLRPSAIVQLSIK